MATQENDLNREEDARNSGMRIIRKVIPYLWPDGEAWVKWRVVIALTMLIIAKVVAVATPFFFKSAVEARAGETPDGGTLFALGAVGLTVAYGVMRLMTIGFQQLRDVVFARVGQRALRRLAHETFVHIHALSLRYHITRKTGGLSRIVERGVKGVEFLLRFLLFSIGPLILELIMIAAILAVAAAGERLARIFPAVEQQRFLLRLLEIQDFADKNDVIAAIVSIGRPAFEARSTILQERDSAFALFKFHSLELVDTRSGEPVRKRFLVGAENMDSKSVHTHECLNI